MRQNIFARITAQSSIQNTIERINRLFQEETIIIVETRSTTYFTLRQFVEERCFAYWKSNANMLSFNDFLNVLGFDTIYKYAVEDNDHDSIVDYIEIIENSIMMFKNQWSESMCDAYGVSTTAYFKTLEGNVLDVLDNLNMEAKYFSDTEQVIIIDRDAAVTATSEISSDETAYEMTSYNHYRLKGNLKEKVKILNYLANEFEAQRNQLKQANNGLADNIAYLLNKLNIRHNNVDQSIPKNYYRTVADMSSDELESWYDELFQMLLLAKLEIANIERRNKVVELKKKIESEKQNNG